MSKSKFSLPKAVFVRFLRAFVAGALASMALIVPNNIVNLDELAGWLYALGIAGVVGGITGVLMGADKWNRSV